jgi:DNA-binding LacI/PurR family transcriptional regulator
MNKNSRSINIHSIANEVGVSVATISRFFNNPDVVKENTKNKIIDVCKKYNYTPSKIARAITTKKTKLIAFIMPSLKDPAFIDIIAGAEKAMSKKGYILCLFNTRQNINREKDIVETIQSMNIDGVMFSCIYGNKEEEMFLLNLQKKDIPIILVDRIIPEVNLPYVMNNDFLGGQIAAKFLMDNNHKKIGILSYSMQVYIFRQRVEGLLKVLNENQIKESFLIEVPLEYKNIEDTINKNIDLMLESGVTAIFCVSDSIAIFLSRLLVEKKIMIPEEISVAGFDNIVFSNFSIPRLTTIDHDMFSLGEKAAENLIFKLETGRFKNKNEVIDPVLIKRDSVRKI